MFIFNIILIVLIQGFVVQSKMELKLLNVLFRHGDKVPHKEYQNYPKDPYNNHSYYPIDSGGLTNEGKLREYKIGKLLREKYNEFFGEYYLPSLISGRSTDFPRTQMSLQLVLNGLFPPSKQLIWNEDLFWTPVYTTSVPFDEDNLLFPQSCPQYSKEYKEFLKQSSIQKIIKKYKNVMDYLTEHSGKQINSTSAVYYLYNLFLEQASQNLSLPEWTNKVYPNPMKEITAMDFNLRHFTKKLKRLTGGILLREIIENIKTSNKKGFFYSAHELNVASMAKTLGIENPVIPLYGSTIIFETYKDEYQQYFIRILLWTGVTEELIVQKIPGCTEYCPFDSFQMILKDVTATKDESNCYKTGNPSSKLTNIDHQYLSASKSSLNQKSLPIILLAVIYQLLI